MEEKHGGAAWGRGHSRPGTHGAAACRWWHGEAAPLDMMPMVDGAKQEEQGSSGMRVV